MTDPKKRLRFYNWFFLPMTAFLLALTVNLGFKYYQLRSLKNRPVKPVATETQNRTAESYDISSSILLDGVLSIVQSYYVDPERVDNENLLQACVDALGTMPGIKAEKKYGTLHLETSLGKKEYSFPDQPDYQGVVDTLTAISADIAKHENKLAGDDTVALDMQEASVRFLNNILSGLDAHSALLSPEAYRELRQGTEGSFGGLGVLVGIRDNLLTVIRPLPRSPAQRAGITRYDRILGIDGKDTYGHTLDELVEYMRGDPGTPVQLSLLRDGAVSPTDMTMRREIIQVDSVTSYNVNGPNGSRLLRLAIESFSSRTSREVLGAIKKFRAENGGRLDGLILDLRMNPGGLLDQAVQVADLFLQKGVIVSTKGRREEIESAGTGFDEVGFPMAVLIDSDSASASEIVAGALQDHGRAIIVGQPSFGKGSVQTIFELPGERALKLTIARYYTPSGKSIQNIGIIPDVWLQPVLKGQTNENLLGSYRYKNERFLRNHLESTAAGTNYVSPKYTTKAYYLTDNRMETEFDERKEDLELSVATEIMGLVHKSYRGRLIPGTDRASHWLAIAGPTLNARLAKLDEETGSFLKSKFNLAWSPVASSVSNPKLKLEIESPDYQNVKPGETLRIRYKVTNTGTSAANRLSVFVRSEAFGIDTKEFLIGDIAPAESRSGELSYQVFKGVEEGPAQLRIGVGADAWPSADAIADYWVSIDQGHYSELDAVVDLVDEAGGQVPGVLECKENAKIRVTLFNKGDVPLNNVDISVMNLAGSQIDLKDTIRKLSKIGVGESKYVEFALRGSKVLHNSDLAFGVFADSSGLRAPLKQRVQIRGLPSGTLSKAANLISH